MLLEVGQLIPAGLGAESHPFEPAGQRGDLVLMIVAGRVCERVDESLLPVAGLLKIIELMAQLVMQLAQAPPQFPARECARDLERS